MSAQPAPFQSCPRGDPGWETITDELQYSNPHLQVFLTRVRTPSRPDGVPWTVTHRKAGAVIAPMTPDGRLLLIRQERVPLRATLWEFPAGQVDDAGPDDAGHIRAAAIRELGEETGYELSPGGELIPMGYYFTSPGFTDEHCYLFLARGVIPSPAGPSYDANESIHECRPFTIADVSRMIAENEVRDANTICAFARMWAMGLISAAP